VEFFFDIHATVDNANDNNLIGLDRVKDQVESYHKATEPRSKARTFPANERKSGQVLKIRIDSLDEVVRRIRIAFFQIPIDAKQIQLCFVGKKNDHSRNYLRFLVRT
jgi:hypothetical protein